MTIKQTGGIFGRNPTFNDVTIDGPLSANDNIVMANGKGIDFSATSGTGTSELFDDYEEGTWTPGFQGATITPTNTVGRYTKIGRVVYFSYYSASSTIASASGGAEISNLPFTVESGTQCYQPAYTAHNTFFGGSTNEGVEAYLNAGNTNIIFTTRGTTSSPSYVNGSAKFIMISGFYLTTA